MLNQKYVTLKLFNVIHIKVENRNILGAQISIPKLFLVLFFFHLLLSGLSGEMTSRCLSLHLKEEIPLLLRMYVRSYVSYMKERHIQERFVNRDYVHKKIHKKVLSLNNYHLKYQFKKSEKSAISRSMKPNVGFHV